MIRGSCLCGGVRFELERAVGPFELCHCSRCRKVSGGAHIAGLGVRASDYRMTQGSELVRSFTLPVREAPPAYGVRFCSRCGSVVPDPAPEGEWLEVPAGLLDDDPGVGVDRHIFVDFAAPWDRELDALPRLTGAELRAQRAKRGG
jgi:hypothetical protein